MENKNTLPTSIRPPRYPPGVVRCVNCKKTFNRSVGRLCPYCHKPHGNQQAR